MSQSTQVPTATPTAAANAETSASIDTTQDLLSKAHKHREAREAWTRILGPKPGQPAKAKNATASKKKKKVKPTVLTDKQRAAEAHAHYVTHHDTVAEAENLCHTNA